MITVVIQVHFAASQLHFHVQKIHLSLVHCPDVLILSCILDKGIVCPEADNGGMHNQGVSS